MTSGFWRPRLRHETAFRDWFTSCTKQWGRMLLTHEYKKRYHVRNILIEIPAVQSYSLN